TAERRVEVQGTDLLVAFTNRGARLVSWRLTRFKDARGREEEMVHTVPGGARPLDVETGDSILDGRLRDALFLPSADGLTTTADGFAVGAAGGVLRLAYAADDLEAEKTLRFEPQG